MVAHTLPGAPGDIRRIDTVAETLARRIDTVAETLTRRIDSRFAQLLTAMIALNGLVVGAIIAFLQTYLPPP